MDRIEVEVKDQSFWWRLKARNGRVLATSEMYSSKGKARAMAAKVATRLGVKLVEGA